MHMNKLYLLTSVYNLLRIRGAITARIFSPFRRTIVQVANRTLPKYLGKVCNHHAKRLDDVIISVTSFPERIESVWMTIQSLKLQTLLPHKIILWLSKEQFPNQDSIPLSLKKLVDDLFEIKMVDGDLRSHKKYFYALRYYPSKNIVTFDDDIFYHPNLMQTLYLTHLDYPNCIISNKTARFVVEKGILLPYCKWDRMTSVFDSKNQVQIGVGGVLYPPKSLHNDVLDVDMFMALTPYADDLWLNAMARLNGTIVLKSSFKGAFIQINDGSPTLSYDNYIQGRNDIQLKNLRLAIIKKYGVDVYDENYCINSLNNENRNTDI